MRPRCDFYSDTDPAALGVFLDLRRRMPPEEKIARVFQTIDLVHRAAAAALRRERPAAGDHEIKMRLASRRLDRETMIRSFGWDPEQHG